MSETKKRTASKKTSGRRENGRNNRTGKASARNVRSSVDLSNRNSILIIVLTVIVIVSAVAGAIVSMGRRQSSSAAGDTTTATGQVTVQENDNALQLDKYPEINTLITNYRRAFVEGDTELLQQVYNTTEEINADVLTATTQIIESYNNSQYYTKRGITAGEYVVFAYDELKLSGIDTLAPNLSVFYVKTAQDGTLYIYRGEYDTSANTYAYSEDVQSYINAIYTDADVTELIATVNKRMDSACASDSSLLEFMQRVRTRTNTSTDTGSADLTEAADETGSDTAESETVSESQDDDASEE